MTTQDIQPNAKTEKESETISADTISAMNTQQEPSVVEIEEEHEKKVYTYFSNRRMRARKYKDECPANFVPRHGRWYGTKHRLRADQLLTLEASYIMEPVLTKERIGMLVKNVGIPGWKVKNWFRHKMKIENRDRRLREFIMKKIQNEKSMAKIENGCYFNGLKG